MKRLFAAFVPLLMMAAITDASAASASTPAVALPDITIYHLEGRRSERLVWLMEELQLPYKLEFKRGDLAGSMAMIRALNPVVPMAPTVKYGDQILVESGAIIDLILQRHAPNKLRPALDSPNYPAHLMWMHYAEGSLAARVFSDYRAWRIQPPQERSRLVDSEAVVQFAEDYLKQHEWFGGSEFSAADIMMKFPLNAATGLNVVDVAQFPKVAAWQAKIEGRPAYKRMLAKARPDGMVGSLPVLPKHAPSGERKPAQ
jgi:glutathione S-transferase